MSTAFRNFFITFIIALIGFGIIGHNAALYWLPSLITDESGEVSVAEHSYGDVDYYAGSNHPGSVSSDSVSEDIKTYLVFSIDFDNNLSNLMILKANKSAGNVTYGYIPPDSKINVNGYNKSFREVFTSFTTVNLAYEYFVNRFIYLTGAPVDGYMVISPSTICRLFKSDGEKSLAEEFSITASVSLPYEIKYEDPLWQQYNELHPEDIHYISITGNCSVNSENVEYIMNTVPEGESQTAVCSSLYPAVFSSFMTNTAFSRSLYSQSRFLNSVTVHGIDSDSFSYMLMLADSAVSTNDISNVIAQSSATAFNWESFPALLN